MVSYTGSRGQSQHGDISTQVQNHFQTVDVINHNAKSNTATFLLLPQPSTSCPINTDRTFSCSNLRTSMSGSPEKPLPTQTSSYSAYSRDFDAFSMRMTCALVCGRISSKFPSFAIASRPRLGLSIGRTALDVQEPATPGGMISSCSRENFEVHCQACQRTTRRTVVVPPHIDAIQRVAVQDVDSTVLVYRLRFLVHQSATLWDIESHNSLRRVVDRLPLSQISNHVPFAVLPRISHILGIGIVDVVIILRPVRPSLLFMFGIVGVVPAFIVYETPVYPRHMQPSVPEIPTVDVRVALHARQWRADKFP